jgi:hypothetical protein
MAATDLATTAVRSALVEAASSGHSSHVDSSESALTHTSDDRGNSALVGPAGIPSGSITSARSLGAYAITRAGTA